MHRSKSSIAYSVDRLWDKKHWLITLALLFTLKIFAPTTFLILLMGGFFFILFKPIVDRLERLTRDHRIAIGIFLITILVLIALSLGVIVPKLVAQTTDFITNIPALQKSVLVQMNNLQDRFQVIEDLVFSLTKVSLEDTMSRYLHQWGTSLSVFLSTLIQSITHILTFLMHLCIAFVASIYLLIEKRSFMPLFKGYMTQNASAREKKFFGLAYQNVLEYFTGLVLCSIISFFLSWTFYSLMGIRFSLLLGLWTGLMEFIPIFGPIIAFALSALVAGIQSPHLIIPVIIYFISMQFLMSNVISPQIIGKTTNFSPLVIFLVLLTGGEMFGIWGMIISIPMVSVLFTFWKVYTNKA